MEDLEDVVSECKIEIEKIVDECIDQAIKEDAESDFKEFKKMENSDSIQDYLTSIHKTILHNRSETLSNRNISMKSEAKILEVAEKNGAGITTLNSKFNKVIFALFALFFLLGVIIGMQSETWTPYIKEVLDFGRTANGFIKLGGSS